MSRTRRVLLATFCAIALFASQFSIAAAASNLTGEGLVSQGAAGQSGTATATCNTDGSGTLSFSVTGTAFGPFPGTYTETGTVTFGATILDPADPRQIHVVTAFSASFVITSGTTTISGTKQLIATPTANLAYGTCTRTPGLPPQANFHPGQLRYHATISTSSGTFTDKGTSSMSVAYQALSYVNVAHHEDFVSEVPTLEETSDLIKSLGLPQGSESSMVAKVNAALNSIASGNTTAACGQLQALIKEAQAQSGKKLAASDAAKIIAAAQKIMTSIGCP